MNQFPEKLREARKAAGLTQTKLAAETGLTQRSITEYERGAGIPRKSTLYKLSKALNVSILYWGNESIDQPWGSEEYDRIRQIMNASMPPEYAERFNEALDTVAATLFQEDTPRETVDAFSDAVIAMIMMEVRKRS